MIYHINSDLLTSRQGSFLAFSLRSKFPGPTCIDLTALARVDCHFVPGELTFRHGDFFRSKNLAEWDRNSDWLLVGPPTPLKNRSSSIGMMTFPIFLGKYKMATKPPTRWLKQQTWSTCSWFLIWFGCRSCTCNEREPFAPAKKRYAAKIGWSFTGQNADVTYSKRIMIPLLTVKPVLIWARIPGIEKRRFLGKPTNSTQLHKYPIQISQYNTSSNETTSGWRTSIMIQIKLSTSIIIYIYICIYWFVQE